MMLLLFPVPHHWFILILVLSRLSMATAILFVGDTLRHQLQLVQLFGKHSEPLLLDLVPVPILGANGPPAVEHESCCRRIMDKLLGIGRGRGRALGGRLRLMERV